TRAIAHCGLTLRHKPGGFLAAPKKPDGLELSVERGTDLSASPLSHPEQLAGSAELGQRRSVGVVDSGMDVLGVPGERRPCDPVQLSYRVDHAFATGQ